MSNLHPIFEEITQRALSFTHEALGVERCTAVGVVASRNVLCQLPDHDSSTSHWAHDPVMGDVTWVDVPRIG